METSEIRKKLQDYIASAEEEKIKAIYTVLESDIESVYDHSDDPEFVAEMDSRVKEIEDGTAVLLTWEEVMSNAKMIIENAKQKSAV
ncbi:addiction module protein [Mucilaginibacter arboris]|uniref:Addiction module component n=1 Tax=Mucilaginibacter arboris TaxID=2682090 RepID=A0A7K1STR9_9SPHI|nr:addiction module protein [Mucilaginibacter arboris]MVN20684.1 hypothetical protein [Mucilaginibacter arboris]